MITGCKSNGIRETPTDNVIEADFIDRDFEKEATETVVDDDDDDDENVISLEKLKRETLVAEDAESELRSSERAYYFRFIITTPLPLF